MEAIGKRSIQEFSSEIRLETEEISNRVQTVINQVFQLENSLGQLEQEINREVNALEQGSIGTLSDAFAKETKRTGNSLVRMESRQARLERRIDTLSPKITAATQDIRNLRWTLDDVRNVQVVNYTLNISEQSGVHEFDTGVRLSKFRTALVGGWEKWGGSRCTVDASLVHMFVNDGTWRLRVQKNEGCSTMRVRVVYLPDEIVGKVETKSGTMAVTN